MNASAKDTIYIDIDDEITAIIDKVRAADNKVVALVLPKRASVLQSIVNMKLLKRTGDEAKKHIVLITSESNLLPLAGAVGLHVAKTLQTKPAIPPAPKTSAGIVAVNDTSEGDEEPELDASKPVGALAGIPPVAAEETIELDDDPEDPVVAKKSPKDRLSKKLKVPNFDRFRNRLFIGGAAFVSLIVLWYLAAFVLPKATITIKTDTESITSNVDFTTKPGITEADLANKVIPGVVKEVKKTDTEKIAASGQKDAGTKASGQITIKNCEDSNSRNVVSGTTFSTAGKNYVSTAAVTVPAGTFSGGGSNCTSATVDAPVKAAENGDAYNRDATSYTSSSAALQGNFKLLGTEMTGGTSKMIKVVSQQDVDAANQKITERLGSSPANELVQALEAEKYYALLETLVTASPQVTTSPKVGEEASEVTVTSVITNTMIGVKKDDLVALLKDSVKGQIDEQKQAIVDDGLKTAVIRVTNKKADGNSSVSLQSVLVTGAQIDKEAVKKEIAGKKRGDTQTILSKRPGVKEVIVDYSPFWVYQTPKKTGKITIQFEQSN